MKPWEMYAQPPVEQAGQKPWEMYGAASPEPQQPQQPQRSFGAEVGRQVGLTARHAGNAVAGAVGMITDPIGATLNLATGTETFKPLRENAERWMTQAGLPQPETPTERVVARATETMTGAVPFIGAGNVLSRSASPVVAGVGSQLAASPLGQMLAGGAGGAGAGTAAEAGAGPVGQTVAGIVAGVGPSAVRYGVPEMARRAVRGGEEGRQTMVDNINRFERAGDFPSLGQASEKRGTQAIESILAKAPGGAGVFAKKAREQNANLGAHLDDVSARVAPGANPTTAGRAIESGVQEFKRGFKDLQGRLYDQLDQHLPNATQVPIENTRAALKDLNANIANAPALSAWFKNAKIQGIEKALAKDSAANAKTFGEAIEGAVRGESMPYEAMKKLRTLVGGEISNNSLVADVPRSKWIRLYNALSDDLGVAAKAAGPDAEQAWRWSNQFSRDQLRRLEEVERTVGKDTPERVFKSSIEGAADGATAIKRILGMIPKDDRREVAGAFVNRMGRATPGQQDALGEVFSPETYLTNWNRMSPEARSTMFGRFDDASVPADLENLASVAQNIRQGSKIFANPSGTGQQVASQALTAGGLASLLSGNPVNAAAFAAAPLAANMAARTAVSPSAVIWAARETPRSPILAPALANILSAR